MTVKNQNQFLPKKNSTNKKKKRKKTEEKINKSKHIF